MKLILAVVLAIVGVVLAEEAFEPIGLRYHDNVGIPEAARIKAAEEAIEFNPSRIVGGSPAGLGQFPYQAGLLISLQSGGTSVCGASLVTNTGLITAAHCWTDGWQNARELTVILGSVFLFSGGYRTATSNVQVHENYNPGNLNNDIAVIRTNWINFSNTISNILLAAGDNNFAGWWATASGFGATSDSSGIGGNQFLSHVDMQVITNDVCWSTYGNIIIGSTICTNTAGGRGTCGGDSGGPLAIVSGGQRVLIGVTSFVAAAGCQRGLPAGFARVTTFLPWILGRL